MDLNIFVAVIRNAKFDWKKKTGGAILIPLKTLMCLVLFYLKCIYIQPYVCQKLGEIQVSSWKGAQD